MVTNPDQFGSPYFPGMQSPEKRASGIQGKLFRDPKPTDDVRWPRGYSPERMSEVRAATSVNPVAMLDQTDFTTRHYGDHVFARDVNRLLEARRRGKVLPDAANTRIGAMKAEEAIARSTIPSEHLELMRTNAARGLLIQTGNPQDKYDKAAGAHFRPSGGRTDSMIKLYRGHYGAAHEHEAAETLLHELGHFHSHATGRPSSEYFTARQQGAEEAYADDYAATHYVPRRDAKPTADSGYESRSTWNRRLGIADGLAAHDAYLTARTTPTGAQTLLDQYKTEDTAAIRRGVPAHVATAQMRLFLRTGSSLEESTAPGYEDRGQHGYESWETEKVPAINGRGEHMERAGTGGEKLYFDRHKKLDTIAVHGDL